ncbi:MAG: hypothetical protein IIU98_02465 [Ruminococcus sp.]|nr:hypothetical protein [Ruminococcus sp.]
MSQPDFYILLAEGEKTFIHDHFSTPDEKLFMHDQIPARREKRLYSYSPREKKRLHIIKFRPAVDEPLQPIKRQKRRSGCSVTLRVTLLQS